jgi:hypothetical protein
MTTKHGISSEDITVCCTYDCEKCEACFKSKQDLTTHLKTKHEGKIIAIKSSMKKKTNNSENEQDRIIKDIEGEVSAERITADINTLMNGKPSFREEKIIKLLRRIATLQVSGENCMKKKTTLKATKEMNIQNKKRKLSQ